MGTSYDVKIWSLERQPGRGPRVRWLVNGQRFNESFANVTLADGFRSDLVTAQRKGEAFDTETGLPVSMLRKRQQASELSFLGHAREFTAREWPNASAKNRVSILETLARVVPVVVKEIPGKPDAAVLRRALTKDLNPSQHAAALGQDEARAITWLEKASRTVRALEDTSVVCDVLDSLAINLDGQAAAAQYFSRRRRVLHKVLGYAVRKGRLEKNPVGKGNLPEGWSPPPKPDDTVDPRSVGSPALIADMLDACNHIGPRQGPRMVAFFACMFYAMMRPSEVSALTLQGCHLPKSGWGYLVISDAATEAGRAYTDNGGVHEHRGLKGRNRGRPDTGRQARRATRKIPIPPELVYILRQHIDYFGVGPGKRLFCSELRNGQRQPYPRSTVSRAWKKVRELTLTDEQQASPLLARPYDLRHSGISWRLNSGVPPTQVAEWAGNSADVLMRVYAHCVSGLEDVWIGLMDKGLHLEDDRGHDGPGSGNGRGPGGATPGPREGRPTQPDEQRGSDPDDDQL